MHVFRRILLTQVANTCLSCFKPYADQMKSCRNIFGLLILVMSFCFNSVKSQELNSYGFPVHSPFADDDTYDGLSPYPFYFADPQYQGTNPNSTLFRGSHQYAFNPGRDINDGNSSFNLYFSDYHDYHTFPAGKPLVVILHGRNGNKDNSRNNRLASAFAKRGYVAIVPDYTTEGDVELWGNPIIECRSRDELLYTINYAVRDVRGAIRRTLFGVDRFYPSMDIDENSIFVLGFSFGAITAAHMSYAGANEYPIGDSVEINGTSYVFESSLDDVIICPNPSVQCTQAYTSSTDYDVKDNIKGVSLLSPMLLEADFVDNSDEVQALLFHGTCDEVVAIDDPTLEQLYYRRQLASGNSNPEGLPCDESDVDYTLFGSARIYKRAQNLPISPTGFDANPSLFILCGAAHGLSQNYFSISTDYEVESLGFYESLRFFSNLINQNPDTPFVYSLDHSLTPNYNELELQPKCEAMPQGGQNGDVLKGTPWVFNVLRNQYCPTCGDSDIDPVLREPMFSALNPDSDRYALLDLTECSPEEIQAEPEDAKMYSLYGDFIGNVKWSEHSGEIVLPVEMNTKKGMYVILFSSGKRKTVIVN